MIIHQKLHLEPARRLNRTQVLVCLEAMTLIVAQHACPAAGQRKKILLVSTEGNEGAICSYTFLCRASGRQIVIDAVWLKYLHLFCLSPVTSEDGLAKGPFDRRLGGSPGGHGWWTRPEQDAASSLPAPLVSVPAHRGGPHLSNHSGTAPSPPRAPQWGKWWLKRTHINSRHNGQCAWHLIRGKTERSDGLMMYLQTAWQRKSVTAGTEVHVTSRAGRGEESVGLRWDLGVLTCVMSSL